ncbi:hypothetical protein GTQ34_16190 [Muricauda sp. JGD-17]|uniref:YHS domain-containing protein n=1 Tax=Flagellimonas ochracea TaxID=2696472 RepID=A0A964TEP2_9FLAO|nr:hypothetical protein [Allomuricauda ochracea]NAY93452.1 hypothetical protein [Allomuricauda ochracea]
MKLVITLLVASFPLLMIAQTDNDQTVIFTKIGELSDEQINSSGASRLNFAIDETEAKNLAKSDLKNGIPFLLLMGGVAPTIIATDPQFEQEYGIYFYEFGCTGPENEILIAYNKTIFDYLQNKYGKKWIKEVRDDVVGFKEWKKAYRAN